MQDFPVACSNKPVWQDAVSDCLKQLGRVSTTANLGFVYVTDGFDRRLPEIYASLKEETGIRHWVGTIGLGICCNRRELSGSPAMAVMLGGFADGSFLVFQSTAEVKADFIEQRRQGLRIAVVHGDARNPQIQQLLKWPVASYGDTYLLGGLSSSHGECFQLADGIVQGQLSGVLFEQQVPILTGLTQGCSPLGETHLLTECEGNIAVRIDDQPALKVLQQEIGEVLAKDLRRTAGYIFAGLPVAGSDIRNYLVRDFTGFDRTNQLIGIAEKLVKNTPILFCKRDRGTAEQDLRKMLEQLKKRLAGDRIKGGLYFSCVARGQHLFGRPSRELEIIAEVLGDFPLVGFYANGEISGDQLYAYTGVITLFV